MSSWLVDLLALLSLLLALLLVLAWLLSGLIVRRRQPDPPLTPAELGLPFEHVRFTARDGLELGGRLTGEPRARRPVVIFCAGMFGSMDGDTPMLPMFIQAGFNVLQFDWRAHGASDGLRTTLGVHELEDLLGAIDFVQARGINRIGLMGFSMGGAVALRAAARDQRVACVVCDGGFVRVQHTLEGFFRERIGLPLRPLVWLILRLVELRLGLSLAEAEPLGVVGQIAPRPVLFIHGGADPFVPRAVQDAILAACGEPKELWRVEGAGHRQAYEREPEAYRQRVIGFFHAHLWVGERR